MNSLLVGVDPVIVFMLEQAAAQAGCESRTAGSAAEALEIVCERNIDVVVADHAPPAIDAVALCAAIKQRGETPAPRVILLAPSDDRFDLRRVRDAGIDDLLVKPFQAIELELRLLANQRIAELAGEAAAAVRALQARATHDPLTGALNESGIIDAVRRECDRAARDQAPLSIFTIEVDGLGIIRDWTGAEAADAALVDVAARVRTNLRPYDSLGRSGPTGFMAALPKCDAEQALSVARRIVAAVGSAPVKGGGRMVSLTASVGLAALDGTHEGRPERLVAAAAAALVLARTAGGNRVATPAGCA